MMDGRSKRLELSTVLEEIGDAFSVPHAVPGL